MRRTVLLGFLLLLAIDTTSNVVIKLAGNRIGAIGETAGWLDRLVREPLILVIIVCYVAAFLTYTALLKHAPVGPAFAAVHGHVVTVLLLSLVLFGESLTWLQALGCVLVVGGIIVLGWTERLEPLPKPPPATEPGASG